MGAGGTSTLRTAAIGPEEPLAVCRQILTKGFRFPSGRVQVSGQFARTFQRQRLVTHVRSPPDSAICSPGFASLGLVSSAFRDSAEFLKSPRPWAQKTCIGRSRAKRRAGLTRRSTARAGTMNGGRGFPPHRADCTDVSIVMGRRSPDRTTQSRVKLHRNRNGQAIPLGNVRL